MVGERNSNITTNLKYIIIIPIYIFTDKLHCLMNTVTALLGSLTVLLEYLDHSCPKCLWSLFLKLRGPLRPGDLGTLPTLPTLKAGPALK